MKVALLLLAIMMFFIIITIIIMKYRDPYVNNYYDDDEEETTTTVTTVTTVTEEPAQFVVSDYPFLKRKKARNGQYYVIDPSDKTKTFVNERDDMYEDAANNYWRLS